MVEKLVNYLIEDLGKHNNYSEIQIEQMKYVTKVITYEMIKFILILLIFFFLGLFKECFLISIFMIILLSKNTNLDITSSIILNLISIFCIYNEIPIINEKMPLTRKDLIKKNRVIGITNTLIFIIISIVMFNVKWLSQTIVWTCVVQVMLLFNKYKR